MHIFPLWTYAIFGGAVGLGGGTLALLLVAFKKSVKVTSASPARAAGVPTNMSGSPQYWLADIMTAMLRPLIRLVYRVRLEHLENLPREGGVIVAANHMSYVDVVLLAACSPRPLRVMAWGGFQKYAFFRIIFRVFGCLPVSPDNARASLREAVHMLQGGGAVLIFPEGQITRTGVMQDFAGGFSLLARHADVPVVPVRLEGLWGSIFSFEGGRFFWKWPRQLPYPVTIRFGQALAAKEATVPNLRQAMLALAAPPPPVNAPVANPSATPPAPTDIRPLVDYGEAEFRARREFESHLGQVLVRELCRQGGEVVIVDCTGQRQALEGAKLLAVSLALARRLRREVPEPRVGIVLPPSLGGFIANYAVMLAGKTPVNFNFTIGRAALETSIRKSGVRATITDKIFREKVSQRLGELAWPERVLDLREEIAALSKAATAAWWCAARVLPAAWVARLAGVPREGGDREAALLFTSGSAGEPKGVVLTHRNILGNGAQIDASGILPRGESVLGNLPIFHSFGFTILLWYAIQHGVRVVTVPSPLDTRRCVEAVADEKISVLLGTPTFLRPYLKRAEPKDFASVKVAVAGAEKTPAGFHEEWEQRFGGEYCEGYGLTETSPVVAVNLPVKLMNQTGDPAKLRRAGTVGRLFTGMAARIVDPDTGAPRGFNESGMLHLRGVNIFAGYLDQPEVTADVVRDGWFVTGDLARMDADGFLTIEGRLSRFSKIGGEMVPHGTVEAKVVEALGLKQGEAPVVAVAARPDPAKGEALVLLTTVDLDATQVREKLAAAGLPNLWIPRVIKRVEAIPLLGSGKLDLRKLRELAKE